MQTYFFSGQTFISQLFHHVHVTGLPYGKMCALAALSVPLLTNMQRLESAFACVHSVAVEH
jgi:gamma-glutamylcysteine synthetase